jgi:hypothetical protein
MGAEMIASAWHGWLVLISVVGAVGFFLLGAARDPEKARAFLRGKSDDAAMSSRIGHLFDAACRVYIAVTLFRLWF